MKLETLRAKIDRLDNRLLKLLNERTRLVADIGRFKLANGQAVFAPERELNLLLRLTQRNRGPLSTDALRAIYREILSSSRASQEPLNIGCFARVPELAFAAARWRFGVSDRYVALSSLDAVRRELKAEAIDAAVTDGHALLGLRSVDSFLHVCERIRDSSMRTTPGFADSFFLASPLEMTPRTGWRSLWLLQGFPATKTGRELNRRPGVLWAMAGRSLLLEVAATIQPAQWPIFQGKTLRARRLGSYPDRS